VSIAIHSSVRLASRHLHTCIMSVGSRCFTAVPNCPKEGVTFYDMAPLLASVTLRRRVTSELAERIKDLSPTLIVALETRGYFPGSWIADALGVPLLMLRKTINATKATPLSSLLVQEFDLEYKKGESIALPLHSIPKGARVLLVDDTMATGGTLAAASLLVNRIQPDSTLVAMVVLLELMGLSPPSANSVPLISLFRVPPLGTTILDVPSILPHIRLPFDGSRIHPDDNRAALMWHPSMTTIAFSLLKAMPNKLRASPIQWEFFPDGWPNVRFEDRKTLQNKDVVFLASFHDKTLIMEQISLMIAVPRQVIKSLRVFAPYFGPGTMERVAVEGDLATAETLAKMCTTCLPSTKGGPPILTFFDIHALCERFYFDDRATVVFESALSLIKKKIIAKRMTVIFPDDGAAKRFAPEFKGQCPMLTCIKTRGEGDERTVTIGQEYLSHAYGPGIDPYTQPAIIIDDLVQSGSTLAECAVALRKTYSFPSISAYVTHAVFPNNAFMRFVTGDAKGVFDAFYVTNTNPNMSNRLKDIGAPFVVLDISPLLMTILNKALSDAPFHAPLLRGITLCSVSKLKCDAVHAALDMSKFKNNVSVFPFETSGTAKQPIGQDDIIQCAIHRLREALALDMLRVSEYHWLVAIESGIVPVDKNDNWQEVTCIAIVKKEYDVDEDATPEMHWIIGPVLDSILFKEIVRQVRQAKGTLTVGELVHANNSSLPADAWYNRQELITGELVKIFAAVQ
jgi:adenine phosphoribosyltransferase